MRFFKKMKKRPASPLLGLILTVMPAFAGNIIPLGQNNALLYYKMGGEGNYALPPVNDTDTINIDAQADVGAGKTCGAFNPLLSISNTFNELQNNVDNLAQGLLKNATGSLAEMPMYFLAQANPTAYNMINNLLVRAHQLIEISTKSCQEVKQEIAQGKNPYQDWATISIGNAWKKHLSLTSQGEEDINQVKKDIDQTAGDDGVPWVKGVPTDSGFFAGGKNQPPIHVVADTVKAGYNALLLRGLNDNNLAPPHNALSQQFPAPLDAMKWITAVAGDQIISTCNDKNCTKQQGRHVRTRIAALDYRLRRQQPHRLCAQTIYQTLAGLTTGSLPLTPDNIALVSTEGLAVSPAAIAAIRHKDRLQQALLLSKLSQEIAAQKVMNKAFTARNILQTGAQIPVVAANEPAQKILRQAIRRLDQDLQSLAFESRLRKETASAMLSAILNSQTAQEKSAIDLPPVVETPPLMQNSAVKDMPKENAG